MIWKSPKIKGRGMVAIGVVSSAIAATFIAIAVDWDALRSTGSTIVNDPLRLAAVAAAFGLAFVLRAIAWQRVLPSLSFGQSLAGIHLALGANHVLPLRLGEPMRVFSVVRREKVQIEAATASTLALRSGDMIAVVGLGLLLAPGVVIDLLGFWGWIILGAVIAAGLLGIRWLLLLQRSETMQIKLPGVWAMVLTVGAWLLESVLVWQSAQWAGLDISARDAVLVTTVAVASQIVAIAPSGFGTYEAASVAAYTVLGHDAEIALVAALSAHAIKTAYSLVAGAVACFFPNPSVVGRLRVAKSSALTGESMPNGLVDDPQAPVVLFMPALNEEDSVANCIRRAPQDVAGHPVQVLVIDDGSTDRTAELAREAGAEVISFPTCRGLGAGVRFGLHHAADMGACAVAFCDADEEYPPEELANLIEPILDDRADYVIGSRFAGEIEHMRPHRRFGNIVLTKALSFVLRRKVTDGQSGYRAFSPDAARNAEVIHDFNYAQVLTLDLVAKGYRYHEVPISYRFRTTGDSFIKLGSYLRKVIPAVYAEINDRGDRPGFVARPTVR